MRTGRRWSLLKNRLLQLRELAAETRTSGARLRLLSAVAWGTLAPSRLRSALVIEPTVEFHRFKLRFRAGQGELTPFLQIRDELSPKWLPDPATRREWVILDAGANVGLFTLLLGRVKQVLAVEPNPETYERLVANLRMNDVAAKTYPVALSDHVGTLRFSAPSGSTVLAQLADDGNLQVDCTTIDAILDDAQVERVDLAKLDLEGHEAAALVGGANSLRTGRIDRLYIEFNDDAALTQLDATLAPYGYCRTFTSGFNAVYLSPRLRTDPS